MDTPARKLRVGFVGGGLIARSHALGLAQSRAQIIGCFDLDGGRASAFAAAHGGVRFGSLDELIDSSDAVYVCTYTNSHQQIAASVVQAGKALFCEKPLAFSYEQAKLLEAEASQAEVVNQVGLVLRRSPAFRWLHHQLVERSDELGPLLTIHFRDDQYFPIQGLYASTWRSDQQLAGAGTLLEHSIHDLDLLGWLMGPIHTVSAVTRNFHGHDGIEDFASVRLEAESGAVAQLVSIWHDVLSRRSQRQVEVFCQRGYLAVDGDWDGPVRWEIGGAQEDTGVMAGAELTEYVASVDGHGVNPDAAFVDSVLWEDKAYPALAEALPAHFLCDAAYRSASQHGAPVSVAG